MATLLDFPHGGLAADSKLQPRPPAPVVRLRGFTRSFGANVIIEGLDLDIAPGEFVALLGRSGSGKTTLLRTLAGLDDIAGQDVVVPKSRAVVFQDARLLPWKRVWKNVALGLRGRDVRERAEAALHEVGLGHRLDAWPLTLSGGEAQRTALARALVREPQLLLLDEPFAAVDALTRIRMHALVLSLWRAHRPAVMLVTHDVDEAILLADRVLVLDRGRIAAEERIEAERPRSAADHRELRARLLHHLGVEMAAVPHVDEPPRGRRRMNAVTPFVAETRAARLDDFVDALGRLLDVTGDEAAILAGGAALLETLVARDDWLPDAFAAPDPARYRQYLLHLDPRGRFSVVSFVWGPGQATPIHDHRVWGLVGVLRGAERNQSYARGDKGGLEPMGLPELLGPGAVAAVSPRVGDIHSVANAHADRVSISIHVYGGDIGRIERATYDLTGRPKRFVSGYANATAS